MTVPSQWLKTTANCPILCLVPQQRSHSAPMEENENNIKGKKTVKINIILTMSRKVSHFCMNICILLY